MGIRVRQPVTQSMKNVEEVKGTAEATMSPDMRLRLTEVTVEVEEDRTMGIGEGK